MSLIQIFSSPSAMVFFSFCVVFIWVPMLSKVPEEPSNPSAAFGFIVHKAGQRTSYKTYAQYTSVPGQDSNDHGWRHVLGA